MLEWEQQEQERNGQDAEPERSRISSLHRRVYGRGLFDGLRMAGIPNPENFMKEQKLTRAAQGLNGVAQRVLDAVPIAEAWPKHRIVQEMHRAYGSADVSIIEGCLRNLHDKGLIREHPLGVFQRIMGKPRMELVASVDTDVAERTEILVEASRADPLAQLGAMAEMANDLRMLAQQLNDMAKSIEAAALASEERLQRASTDAMKLTQLRELFRSLGGA